MLSPFIFLGIFLVITPGIKAKAESLGLTFDAMNSNTFQDYGQKESYKNGSLGNASKSIRDQAIAHNVEVIRIGEKLGSKALTVWLADGSNFPGQANFRNSLTVDDRFA